MLMVYILLELELPIKSVYYTKISSRTAADPLEQFRYALKLYLGRYSLVSNRRFAYGLAIWLCLRICQIDFN